jgi:type IV pilus assembly protein PilW
MMAGATSKQHGFSLVEVMVGMVMALVATLVVYEVFQVNEKQKRSTTAGNDAQQAVTFSSYALSKDIGNAGAAFMASMPTLEGCPAAVKPIPVIIQPGANNLTPDTVIITQGTSRTPSLGVRLLAATSAAATSSLVQSGLGFQNGDRAIIANPDVSGQCELLTISAVSAPDASGFRTLTHNAVANTYTIRSQIVPLGQPNSGGVLRYGVGANALLTIEDTTGTAGPQVIATGIVNVKAQYGVDTNEDGVVEWVNPTGTYAEAAVRAMNVAQLRQIRAIRIAVVARSEQPEKPTEVSAGVFEPVTRQNIVLFSGTANAITLDLGTSTAIGDARSYRYRVIESTISLRNVAWNIAGS